MIVKNNWSIVAILIGLFVILLTSFYNYLLFHGIAETFSVLIAGGVFFFAWNSKEYLKSNYFLFIGIAYLFIGIIDMAHTFAYEGMGVFTGINVNHPTQLWIAARYLESISLLLAFLFFKRKLNPNFLFAGFFLLTSLIFTSIFYWEIFPDCYIVGFGLTSFKIGSEYIISAILISVIVLLFRYRSQFDKNIHRLLVASIICTIIAELFFTFYVSVFGLSNLMGHLFKIISFYLIYKAIIITGLKEPYSLLLREIKQSEDQIKANLKEKETLLQEIHHRVKNNMAVISSLLKIQAYNMDDKRLKDALMDSQNRVQSMSAIHETLYQSESLSSIDLSTYLPKLAESIAKNYTTGRKVNIKIEAENILISVKQASPIGLIVNELITNSLKYAFPENAEGEIKISLTQKEQNQVELEYADNGIGMPKNFDWQKTKTMGLKLVKALANSQLDGSIDMDSNNGTKYTMIFKIDET